MAETELLSVAQAAKLLGITRQAALKRIRTGRLEATKVGRSFVVPAAAVHGEPGAREPVLTEIVRRLVEVYEPERVYLFGSAARGEGGPQSDYDIVLVMPDDAPPELLRAGRAYEALWGIGTAVDVLVWTRSAFEGRAAVRTSLPAIVLREGRLLHAA